MHQPRTSCVFIPNAEHFQQCAEFLPFRNRGFGPRAVTVLPVPFARRAAATSLRRRAIDSAPFSSLGERQKGRPAVSERRGLPLAGDWLLLRRTRSRGRKTLFGAAIARPAPVYVAPAPVYAEPTCYWTRGAPVWDGYRGIWYRPRIQVCDSAGACSWSAHTSGASPTIRATGDSSGRGRS